MKSRRETRSLSGNSTFGVLLLLILASFASAEEPAERPFLGVKLNMDVETATVVKTSENGPAEKAGVKAGDVITAFNGSEIASRTDLLEKLALAKPEQVVDLTVLRDGENVALRVTLGKIKKRRTPRGVIGEQAPEWKVDTWDGLPEGKQSLDIGDFKGKVVYLYCFQSWCPACLKHGFPTLKKVNEALQDDDAVAFVAVQTVFEGVETNTFERGKEVTREKFGLDIPLGHNVGVDGKFPSVMKGYKTGGTPWTVIIDKQGIVRFNGFFLPEKQALKLIQDLRDEETAQSSSQQN